MKRILALILTLVMIAALVACGGSPSTSTSSTTNATNSTNATNTTVTSNNATTADTPKTPSRDTVNISINKAMTTNDAHATVGAQELIVFNQIYEGLVSYNEGTGNVDLRLAKEYTIKDDNLTYVFTLRDDVYFHNGEKMKASDVVFSIDRARDAAMAVSKFLTKVESVKATDEYTVEIALKEQYAPFLTSLTHIYILNEKEVTAQGAEFGSKVHGAATGPYKLADYDADVKICLDAYDKYYRGEAAIKHVNIYPITDSAAGLIAFESGNLDWYANATIMEAQRIEKEGKFNVDFKAANHLTYVILNPVSKNEALQNEKVRQAIGYAINKEEMNYAAFEGVATVADYLVKPDANYSAPKSDVVYSYNPKKAKALLAEAGYPNGVDVGVILCFKGSHFETCATVLQSQLAAVGIKATLEWSEQSTCSTMYKAHDFDIGVYGTTMSGDYDDIRKMLYSKVTNYVDLAGAGYDVAYMDSVLDASSMETDYNKRVKLNAEYNDLVMNTAVELPVLHKAVPFVWDKALSIAENYPANPVIFEWSWK